MEKCVSIFENFKRSDSILLISFLSFGRSSNYSSGLSIFYIQTDNSRYHVYKTTKTMEQNNIFVNDVEHNS
jgi:hypothetical protein